MKALYLDDSYMKEFDATVSSIKDNKFVILDQTGFYPNSGGQPHDLGKFVRKSDGKEFNVIFVGKFDGTISHEIENGEDLKEGDEVQGVIDWERRYKLMRMHTAAHVVSATIHEATGALVSGNQKGVEKTRIDFNLEDYNPELIKELMAKASKLMEAGVDVEVFYMPRDEALKQEGMVKLMHKMPPDVDPLRIVKIGDIDTEADGGTHVKNTKECGKVKVLKLENKGKSNRRVYFDLEN